MIFKTSTREGEREREFTFLRLIIHHYYDDTYLLCKNINAKSTILSRILSCCALRLSNIQQFHISSFLSFVIKFDITRHIPSRPDWNEPIFVRFKLYSVHSGVTFQPQQSFVAIDGHFALIH